MVLPILLHGLLLAVKRRSLEVLGSATLRHWVCAGTVCRWLARLRFPVERWHAHACRRLLAAATRLGLEGDWGLALDGTDTKRGGLAKIQNTRRYGKKPKRHKGGLTADREGRNAKSARVLIALRAHTQPTDFAVWGCSR